MPSNNRKRESSSEGKETKAMTDQQTAQVDPEPEPQAEAEATERTSWGPTHNSVELLGRFAFDPEMRYTPGGKAVVSTRLIVNGRGGAQGFDLVMWERLGGDRRADAAQGLAGPGQRPPGTAPVGDAGGREAEPRRGRRHRRPVPDPQAAALTPQGGHRQGEAPASPFSCSRRCDLRMSARH